MLRKEYDRNSKSAVLLANARVRLTARKGQIRTDKRRRWKDKKSFGSLETFGILHTALFSGDVFLDLVSQKIDSQQMLFTRGNKKAEYNELRRRKLKKSQQSFILVTLPKVEHSNDIKTVSYIPLFSVNFLKETDTKEEKSGSICFKRKEKLYDLVSLQGKFPIH